MPTVAVGTYRHPQRSRMSHMSEQAGSAPGGPPPDGEEDARGEAAITELAAQYKGHVHKRHVPSRGQQSAGDDGPETSFRPAAATSYVIRRGCRPRCK